MVKNYCDDSPKTINDWIDIIKTEFDYIKVNQYKEIVKILSIDSNEEIDKIKSANLIVFGEKLGILTFEDACKKLKIKPINIDDKFLSSVYKLKIITQAVNDGWYPNWANNDEYKYVVYLEPNSGFSYYTTTYHDTHTTVPSALCFKTAELAYFMGNHFNELYKIYFM